ncbi:hypothetical protein CJU76_18225 [Pseudomonas fragi]|nr:hypothetical protein CJU76_18225 [Pseudomonas fragi]
MLIFSGAQYELIVSGHLKEGGAVKRWAVAMMPIVLAGCGNADVEKAHSEVAKVLFDGDSAKFRNDRVLYLPPTADKIVCGEVNAKNRFGGYAGYILYVVEGIDEFPYAKLSSEGSSEIKITCSLGKPKSQ